MVVSAFARSSESLIGRGVPGDEATRFVTDLIAGMTEEQALRTHRRLTGIDLGPLIDPAAN